jgi:hypothetical protein
MRSHGAPTSAPRSYRDSFFLGLGVVPTGSAKDAKARLKASSEAAWAAPAGA